MCATEILSKNIIKIGSLSFQQRMEVKGNIFNLKKLSNLNNQLSSLYSLIYSQFDSISKSDYKIFGPMLNMLLDSLQDLIRTLKKIQVDSKYSDQIETLEDNYSALFELDSDIRNFKTESVELQKLKKLLKATSEILHSQIS